MLDYNKRILQNIYGNTAIHYIYQILLDSVYNRDYLYIMEIIYLIIVKYNGNIYIKNNNDISPYDMAYNNLYINETLTKCILNKRFEYIQYLINLGCNINYQDKDGNTALHYLCMNNLLTIYKYIKILLEYGANANILNNVKLKPENYLLF